MRNKLTADCCTPMAFDCMATELWLDFFIKKYGVGLEIKNTLFYKEKQKELTIFYKYTDKKYPEYLKNRVFKLEARDYFQSLDINIFKDYINHLTDIYKKYPSYRNLNRIFSTRDIFKDVFMKELKISDLDELYEFLYLYCKELTGKIIKMNMLDFKNTNNCTIFLYALILFVSLDECLSPEQKDLTRVLELIKNDNPYSIFKKLTILFDKLPMGHPAKEPWVDTLKLGELEIYEIIKLSKLCLKNYIYKKLAL